MKALLKIIAAVVLLVAAGVCLTRFRAGYANAEVKRGEPGENLADSNAAVAAVVTSNQLASTNSVGLPSGSTNTVEVSASPSKADNKAPSAKDSGSKSIEWLGGFIISLILSGGLLAWQVADWFANRAHSAMFATDTAPESDPEYDASEKLALNGDYLGAIESMREYLKRNPAEQYVAIRIAEIYEKDLNNYLAAAMELEEVLDNNISREKWGWTAIHLANIYSGRLANPDKAKSVLHRIIKEAPNTAAAKKARERMGGEVGAAEPFPGAVPSVAQDPHLPQGFGKKKK